MNIPGLAGLAGCDATHNDRADQKREREQALAQDLDSNPTVSSFAGSLTLRSDLMLRNRHSHVTGPKDPSGSLFGPETRENQAKGGLITAKNDGLCFENGTGRFVPARLGQLDDRVRQTWNTTTNPLEGLCAILPVALPSEFARLVVRTPSPSSSRFAYPTACEDETFDRLHLDMP
jgi:hypothetical protein